MIDTLCRYVEFLSRPSRRRLPKPILPFVLLARLISALRAANVDPIAVLKNEEEHLLSADFSN
jgi:hypothetical protein